MSSVCGEVSGNLEVLLKAAELLEQQRCTRASYDDKSGKSGNVSPDVCLMNIVHLKELLRSRNSLSVNKTMSDNDLSENVFHKSNSYKVDVPIMHTGVKMNVSSKLSALNFSDDNHLVISNSEHQSVSMDLRPAVTNRRIRNKRLISDLYSSQCCGLTAASGVSHFCASPNTNVIPDDEPDGSSNASEDTCLDNSSQDSFTGSLTQSNKLQSHFGLHPPLLLTSMGASNCNDSLSNSISHKPVIITDPNDSSLVLADHRLNSLLQSDCLRKQNNNDANRSIIQKSDSQSDQINKDTTYQHVQDNNSIESPHLTNKQTGNTSPLILRSQRLMNYSSLPVKKRKLNWKQQQSSTVYAYLTSCSTTISQSTINDQSDLLPICRDKSVFECNNSAYSFNRPSSSRPHNQCVDDGAPTQQRPHSIPRLCDPVKSYAGDNDKSYEFKRNMKSKSQSYDFKSHIDLKPEKMNALTQFSVLARTLTSTPVDPLLFPRDHQRLLVDKRIDSQVVATANVGCSSTYITDNRINHLNTIAQPCTNLQQAEEQRKINSIPVGIMSVDLIRGSKYPVRGDNDNLVYSSLPTLANTTHSSHSFDHLISHSGDKMASSQSLNGHNAPTDRTADRNKMKLVVNKTSPARFVHKSSSSATLLLNKSSTPQLKPALCLNPTSSITSSSPNSISDSEAQVVMLLPQTVVTTSSRTNSSANKTISCTSKKLLVQGISFNPCNTTSSFPFLLVSASSSANAAAMAAAAAMATGAPPTSLVPVPVRVATYLPPTTINNNNNQCFGSMDKPNCSAASLLSNDEPLTDQPLILSVMTDKVVSTNMTNRKPLLISDSDLPLLCEFNSNQNIGSNK